MKRRWATELLAVTALVVLPLLLHDRDLGQPLHWDEADYATASGAGWVANALDRGDTNPLRHYHPPGLQYLALASGTLFGFSETTLRLPFFLLVTLAPSLVYWLLRRLFAVPLPIALIAGVLLGALPVSGVVAQDARHFVLVGLSSLLVAVMGARCLISDRPGHLVAAAAAFVVAALAMEYVVPLACIFIFGLVVIRNPWVTVSWRQLQLSTRFVLTAAAAVGLLLLLWPAGAMHGPFNFLYYAVVYRSYGHPVTWMGELTHHPPKWAVLWWLFEDSPVATCALVASAASAAVFGWTRRGSLVGIYSLFTLGLFALGLMQHQMNTSYAYYWIPAAVVQGGIALSLLCARFQSQLPVYGAIVVVALVIVDRPEPRWDRTQYNAEMRALAALAQDVELSGKRVLSVGVEAAPARFYLNRGFDGFGRAPVLLTTESSPRGTSTDAHWRVGEEWVPVAVHESIGKLIRASGQRGDALLKVAEEDREALVGAELRAGLYDYLVLRLPLGASDAVVERILESAKEWREVSRREAGTAAIVLYARPNHP